MRHSHAPFSGRFGWNLDAVILVVLLTGVAIRFAGLGHQSIWIDEGYTIELTSQSNFQAMITHLVSNGASDCFMPAYESLFYFWRQIFGTNEVAIRSLSALFGSIAMLACTLAAWRNWGRMAALGTALLAAFSNYGIFYSQEARSYASLHAICALVLLAYLECRSPRSNRHWRLALAALCGLTMWFNIFSAFFLVLLGLVDLISTRSLKETIRFWWLPALAASTYAIWLTMLLTHQKIGMYYPLSETNNLLLIGYLIVGVVIGPHFGPPPEAMRMGIDRLHGLLIFAPQLFTLVATLGFAVWAVWRNHDRMIDVEGKSDRRACTILLVGIGVVIAFLLYGAVMKFVSLPRHVFAAWPALMISLPALLLATEKPKLGAGPLIIVLLVGQSLLATFNYFFDSRYYRDDYRGVAQYLAIETTAHAGTKPIIVFGMPFALRYYYKGPLVDATHNASTKPSYLKRVANNTPRLLVIVNRPYAFRPDYQTYLQAAFAPDYVLRRHVLFQYFVLYDFIHK